VRLELAWHILRELDSINLMAEALERRERSEARKTKGESNTEHRMMELFIVQIQTIGEVPARTRGMESWTGKEQ
jgi:hypothetical protein